MAAAEESEIVPVVHRRRVKGLTPKQLERRYPSLRVLSQPASNGSRGAWIAVFRARPDAMAALLGDFIKQVHAQPGRIGQRPMPREEQVDLHSLVYGEDNDLPLIEVLPKLMRGTRTLAEDAHLSRMQVRRMLLGDYDPDINELRMIAAAVGKPPTYFVEYRKAMVLAAVCALLEDRPGVATTLYRRYLEVRS